MKKKLSIKGITFPDFGDDDSKKNFRLVFHVGYNDENGDEAVAVVAKPDDGHWQWRKKSKDAFLTPTVKGDSVTLDTLVLKNGDGKKIPPMSHKIAEIEGELTDVSVQFMDVHDDTIGSLFTKTIFPELLTAWTTLGIDPIDLVPVPIPGGIRAVIKKKIKVDELLKKSEDFFAKKAGDKVLHTISTSYEDEKLLELRDEGVEWKKGKTGTYAIAISVA
jgi:hypothetical protein